MKNNKQKIVLGGDTEDTDILSWIVSWIPNHYTILHNRPNVYDIESVCIMIKGDLADKGILISDLGVDAAILANREGELIRAVACFDIFTLRQAMKMYDVNILCIGLEVLGPGISEALVKEFLQ